MSVRSNDAPGRCWALSAVLLRFWNQWDTAVLLDIQNRKFRPYLTTTNRILISYQKCALPRQDGAPGPPAHSAV
jgi:hypothetical protein